MKCLVFHFLRRMFDSEMFSTRGQWGTVAVSALAMALPAGFLLLDPPYAHRAVVSTPETLRAVAIADQLALLTLVFAVAGVLALLAWQSLFPSRRDYLALAGLPVRSRQIFAARFGAVLILAGTITVAMSILPTLMSPHQFTAAGAPASTAARAASYSLEALFVFLAIVSIQGVMINVLPAREFKRLSAYVQGALIAVFVFAGIFSWNLLDWREDAIGRLPEFAAWAPPVWFAGLHQAILGDRDPFFAAMAARALGAVALAVTLAALMYAVAYGRYRTLLLECTDAVAARRHPKRSFVGLLAREPRTQAVLRFIAIVFARSRVHRLVLAAYAGGGLALMINSSLIAGTFRKWSGGWPGVLQFIAVYWPIGLSFIVLAGVRHAFSMPAELRANWLFQITESQGRREWMSAVEQFVTVCVIAPIHLLVLPVGMAVFGWPVALRMVALQLLVSLSAFEFLFYSWQQLPFTCSYAPGKRPLVALLATWIAVLGALVPALARIIAGMSQMTELFLIFLVVFGAVWLWARNQRREGWGEARLIYEDRVNAVADLGIKDIAFAGWGGLSARAGPSGPAGCPTQALEELKLMSTGASPQTEGPRPQPERPVAISLRLYRALAGAFPHEFKNAYGEEQVQVTEDSIEPIWRRHGRTGLLRLLADIAIRVPAEHLSEIRQDVRHGLRVLARSPGSTAVALISLSLGIGVATSAFSDLNGTILRNVPGVYRPDELVTLEAQSSYPTYTTYSGRSDLFSSTLAYVAPVPFGVSTGGHTERTWGHLVTPTYFSALGVRPSMGRLFSADSGQSGQAPTLVVSYRFWENHLGSDPLVIGKTLRINGQPATIVGVGPKDFLGASPMLFVADLWLPIHADPRVAPELADNALERRDRKILQVVGRLRPGVTAARAEAELDTVTRQLEQSHGEEDKAVKGRRLTLLPGGRLIPIPKQSVPTMVSFFMVLGGMVLLIACSNVANILLARASDRRKEIAIRLALGAGRARIVRQLLTESLLLAVGAGGLGFLLTIWLMGLAARIKIPYPMPVRFDVEPDGRVLLFALVVSLFTGLVFGLAPALRATRTDLTPALKEGGEVRFRGYRRLSLRNLLVLSQVAASLTLLVLTAALVIGFQQVIVVQAGFEAGNLHLLSLDPVRDGYTGARSSAVLEKLLDRVQRLPSVTAASLTKTVPMALSGGGSVAFSATGSGDSRLVRSAQRFVVGQDYFKTVGVPILLGRGFLKEDEAPEAAAVVINDELGRELWPAGDAIGRRIDVGDGEVTPFKLGRPFEDGFARLGKGRHAFEVVGVAGNEKSNQVRSKGESRPVIYFPLRRADLARPSVEGVTLLVRAAPGVDAIAAVRREISAMDDRLTPFNPRSMSDQISATAYPFRVAMWTYAIIGVFGLILVSVGLAGVTAYSVTQRRREIGIRIALGAARRDVLGLVMKEGLGLVTAGSVIGLAGAWAATRLLWSMLYAAAKTAVVSTRDPLLLGGASLIVVGLTLIACYVPARRSLRIDPAAALRQE